MQDYPIVINYPNGVVSKLVLTWNGTNAVWSFQAKDCLTTKGRQAIINAFEEWIMCKVNDPSDSMNDGLSPSHSTGDSSIEQRKQLGSDYDDCKSDEEDRRYNTRQYHYKKQPHFNAEKNDNVKREKKKEEMIEELIEQMSS